MSDQKGDTSARADRARDHDDHARDRGDRARNRDDHGGDHDDHEREQGEKGTSDGETQQFAKTYPDPTRPGLLQVWPARKREEFDSEDSFWEYMDALSRWNNLLPPKRPLPRPDEAASAVPEPAAPRSPSRRPGLKVRHVGLRLTERDYELLSELASAHAVALGTMARMLVVRGVRAAAKPDRREPEQGG
jgi:hypothetical protein